MRFQSLSHCVIAVVAIGAWSHTAQAEHTVATGQAEQDRLGPTSDTALEKYGIVPTLTLRLGFDLI